MFNQVIGQAEEFKGGVKMFTIKRKDGIKPNEHHYVVDVIRKFGKVFYQTIDHKEMNSDLYEPIKPIFYAFTDAIEPLEVGKPLEDIHVKKEDRWSVVRETSEVLISEVFAPNLFVVETQEAVYVLEYKRLIPNP